MLLFSFGIFFLAPASLCHFREVGQTLVLQGSLTALRGVEPLPSAIYLFRIFLVHLHTWYAYAGKLYSERAVDNPTSAIAGLWPPGA